jgi:hypothetical protein
MVSSFGKEHKLQLFGNKMLRKLFGLKKDKVSEKFRRNVVICNVYRMVFIGQVSAFVHITSTLMVQKFNLSNTDTVHSQTQVTLTEKPLEKRPLGRLSGWSVTLK